MEVLEINTFSTTCSTLGPQWTQIVHQTVWQCMVVQCHKHVLLSIYISTLMSTQKVIWSCLIMAGVCSVMSYTLLLSLIEYKTIVLWGDFQRAQEVLPTIPIEHLNRYDILANLYGTRDEILSHIWSFWLLCWLQFGTVLRVKRNAGACSWVATDPDYKFDLAVQLGRLEIAKVHYYLFKHFGLA
jgi:hypothetical protein